MILGLDGDCPSPLALAPGPGAPVDVMACPSGTLSLHCREVTFRRRWWPRPPDRGHPVGHGARGREDVRPFIGAPERSSVEAMNAAWVGVPSGSPSDSAVELRDGHQVRLWAIRPDEAEPLRGLVDGPADQSHWLRFFNHALPLSPELTRVDFQDRIAFVGLLTRGIRAIADCPRCQGSGRRAEIAIAVADDRRGFGPCRALLEHLLAAGRRGQAWLRRLFPLFIPLLRSYPRDARGRGGRSGHSWGHRRPLGRPERGSVGE